MSRSLHRAGLPAHIVPAALGAVLIAAGIGTGPANAQSFLCHSARYADEKTVCRDPRLGQLDQELADVYRRVMVKLPRRDAEALDKNEDLFVTARRRCGENRACIEQSYRNRIQELQSALPQEESDRKAGGRAQSKGSDRQQASPPDRGTTEDQRGESSDANRTSPEAVVASPVWPGDQGEAKSAPVMPPPAPPMETRSRRDETTSAVANPPSRHEAEAALASGPVPEKRSGHKHRSESVAGAPAVSDHDKQAAENGGAVPERHPAASTSPAAPERHPAAASTPSPERHPAATASTAAPERHPATTESTGGPERGAATSGSTVAPKPARPPEKRHSKARTATAADPSPSPPPQEQPKAPAPSGGTNWVNPAPSP